MKLHEVTPTAQGIITAVNELKDIPQIIGMNSKAELESAIADYGIALVFIQESAAPIDPSAPDLFLDNTLIIAVLENPQTNQTGMAGLQITGLVLKSIHQYDWSEPGLTDALVVDNPAYTKGELDTGLESYFCNFRIKTIE